MTPHDPRASPALLALLAEARDRPEDDGPRRVLADWLEDHGDASRAEFLRLQLRLAPGRPPLEPQQQDALEERCRALLERHGGAWLGPLWRWGPAAMRWHRGLLAVRPPPRSCLGPLLEMAPWLDTLLLEARGRPRLWRDLGLAGRLGLNHLALDLRMPLGPAALLEALASLPESARLRSLNFSWPLRLLVRRPEALGGEARAVPAVAEAFLMGLLRGCPAGRHLSHLGSDFAFSSEQADLIRALGVAPVHASTRWWMHELPPHHFRRPSR